jgi:LmbE family N-acetylglucosaminyl deacetylase
MIKFRWFVCGLALWLSLPAGAQQGRIPDAAELEIALHKLTVLGSVLYVGAHPDDENSSVLAYLSKGRKYRSAYLSVTRGEGGQNLIGAEKGVEIGLLRTQELMSARRIDGAEQFFTRAVDFGYSKTAEESFAFWGREKILGDIVWIIRKFRPDVIITRFTPESSGGHGHHTAAAILTRDAFAAAADPNRFPEQLKYVPPWQAKRLLWNSGRPSPDEAKTQIRVDTGEYNPLLGMSYSEIAGESRSQHKSQGFGSAGRRGSQVDTFALMAGEPATRDLFDGIDTTWNRVPGGKGVGLILADCLKFFDPLQPAKSIPGLLGVRNALAKLPDEIWVRTKKDELTRVIQACAGLWMEAMADDFAAAPGDKVRIRTTVVNRSGQPFTLHSLTVPPLMSDSVPDRALENNVPCVIDTPIQIPKDFPLSQPYWLAPIPEGERFSGRGYDTLGAAENPPSLAVKIGLKVEGNVLEYSVPVLFRSSDPVEGERYRPFEIRPPVTLHVENKVVVFAGDRSKTVKIRLKSHSQNLAGLIRIKGPDGWKIVPAGIPFSLAGKYEEGEVAFDIAPPKNSGEADLRAEVEIGGAILSRDMVSISYPHIHPQVYFPESRFNVVRLDVKTEGKRLG